MSTQEFESQEQMDDVFEDMMEREQDKARLRESIESAESNVEMLQEDLRVAEEELSDLREELEELER